MADNIKQINSTKSAVSGKLYYDRNGDVYIGMPNGRLRLQNSNNTTITKPTTYSNEEFYNWVPGQLELDLGDTPILDETFTIAFPGVFPTDKFIATVEDTDKELFQVAFKAGNGNITVTISSHVFVKGKYKINYIRYIKE